MGVLSSIDQMIANEADYGMLRRYWLSQVSNTTAATSTSGYQSARRFPKPLIIPTLGSGITGAYVTSCRVMSANGGCSSIVAAEFDLGTLTVSGNTFSGAGTMPTRRYNDKTAVQTASTYSMLVVNTALTATTPVVTITYTDQSGNTGNTATLTLPTSPVINTAFLISPHLANADTGIRAITNMSISTGSAGILKVYGLLPIALGTTEDLSNPQTPDIIPVAQPMWQLKGADSIAVYQIGKATVDDAWMTIAMIGDTA